VPEARFRRAVAASAARYAFPSWSEKFPYGLAGSPVDRTAIVTAFSRNLVVVLGDHDVTDRERDAASLAQGNSRFARGLRFFAVALDQAGNAGVPLRWQLRIVPGGRRSLAGAHGARSARRTRQIAFSPAKASSA
jgi:hypothetical protein